MGGQLAGRFTAEDGQYEAGGFLTVDNTVAIAALLGGVMALGARAAAKK